MKYWKINWVFSLCCDFDILGQSLFLHFNAYWFGVNFKFLYCFYLPFILKIFCAQDFQFSLFAFILKNILVVDFFNLDWRSGSTRESYSSHFSNSRLYWFLISLIQFKIIEVVLHSVLWFFRFLGSVYFGSSILTDLVWIWNFGPPYCVVISKYWGTVCFCT